MRRLLKRISSLLAKKTEDEIIYSKKDIDIINKNPFLREREAANFNRILALLPKNARVLEIGTFKGWTSILMCRLKKDLKVTTIDPHFGFPKHPELSSSEAEVNKNIASRKFEDKIKHIKTSSQEFITSEKFDFIFIDGDHTFEGVKFDFNKFFPNLKKDGIIAFHDYGCHAGVTQFCNSLINKKIFSGYIRLNSILCFRRKL